MPGVSVNPERVQAQLPLLAGRLDPTREFSRPFLKWAGGKTQLLRQLEEFYPPPGTVGRYIEPFLGSGAVFFHFKAVVKPKRVVLWDNNRELIETFKAVRDEVEGVIDLLAEHRNRHEKHGKSYFLEMRRYRPRKPAAKAARLIYLNKTCFNGLYRVNSRGYFNVPFGRYANPSIMNEDALRQAARQLAKAKIEAKDFDRLMELRPSRKDFIYFDPPYHPRSSTAYFTSYTPGSFGEEDQVKLAEIYKKLDERGCMLMLSNSETDFVKELYRGFTIEEVTARRNINSKADRRGPIKEVVVLNKRLLEACDVRG